MRATLWRPHGRYPATGPGRHHSARHGASYDNGTLRLAADLARHITDGDVNYLSSLDMADAYGARNGMDLPPESEARLFGPGPACVTQPVLTLDLVKAGITIITWAVSYAQDFNWLKLSAFTANGNLRHQRGVWIEPGLFFLGLPWKARRAPDDPASVAFRPKDRTPNDGPFVTRARCAVLRRSSGHMIEVRRPV